MPPLESKTRIICIAPPDVAEMLDTLVLLYALRRHFADAHLAVACDPHAAPLAQACTAVNEVVVLQRSWLPGFAAIKNAYCIRNFDWAIAATARVDARLAALVKLTKANVRIGFERRPGRSSFFTDPVALPEDENEHRVETLLRLLVPLGLVKPTHWTTEKTQIQLPESAREFFAESMELRPFVMGTGYVLINLRSSGALKFSEKDIITLAGNILSATPFAVALVTDETGQRIAGEIGLVLGSERIGVVETSMTLEFAALLEQAVFLLTVEDEAAHLAAAMGTPAVVVWSGGDFKRTHSRCRKHIFVQLEAREKTIPVERVWQAALTLLSSKKYDVEKQWADLLQLPPSSDLTL